MSSSHPYCRLDVPKDAPFELRPSPGKGWGVFAKTRIERGALILRETPLFVIRKPSANITEQDIWMAFVQLPQHQKEQFLLLRDNASSKFPTMKMAFAENSFNLATPDDFLPVQRPPAHGLFLLHSRFNHSCKPNVKIPIGADGEVETSFATRDILAGEELTFNYEPDFECRTRSERHQALRFTCKCRACLPGTLFQQLSDARRRLQRGLQYLMHGVDPVGGEAQRTSGSPIIIDAQLRRAAEAFDIPISSRFIYSVLSAFLLEQEGLLDDFMLQRVSPGLETLVGLFRTPENSAIAMLAMAQSTWLERVKGAFRLYQREDAADRDVAEVLRIARHRA